MIINGEPSGMGCDKRITEDNYYKNVQEKVLKTLKGFLSFSPKTKEDAPDVKNLI